MRNRTAIQRFVAHGFENYLWVGTFDLFLPVYLQLLAFNYCPAFLIDKPYFHSSQGETQQYFNGALHMVNPRDPDVEFWWRNWARMTCNFDKCVYKILAKYFPILLILHRGKHFFSYSGISRITST